MFLNGRCQIYQNGNLVDYDIISIRSMTTNGGDPKRNYADYKGKVTRKDLNLLSFNVHDSAFVYICNKESHYYGSMIEYDNCIVKKVYPYKIPFLSKWCYVIIHITHQNKTTQHKDAERFFLKDKIQKIISNI